MKPYTIIDAEQRSDAWKKARCARLTGTAAADMLAIGRAKNEESYKRRDLRIRLVCERLTGLPQESDYVSREMQYGIDKEPDAFAAYEAATGSIVRRTGFIAHNTLPIGCSLDGDVDDCLGIVELKCPKSFTHLSYLRDPKPPADYVRGQITHNLFVSAAEWCDFVSFDDRFPPELQLVIRRVRREDVDLKAYELALRLFLSEVDLEYAAVQALQQKAVA